MWLKDIKRKVVNDNVICYRFQRVPFGVIPSAFLLSATLNYHLENHKSDITMEVRENLYVDNTVVTITGTQETFNKYNEMKKIFKEASVNEREFLSNDDSFNKGIPEIDQAKASEIKKILGLYWNPKNDTIIILLKLWNAWEITKITILQFTASQCDPLGFLVPVMIQFKLFLQGLWKKNREWDKVLEDEDRQAWYSLIKTDHPK